MATRKFTYPKELRAFNTALDSADNLEKYFIENTAIECFSYNGTGPWFKEIRLNRLFDDLNFIFVDNNFLFVRSVIEVHGDFYKAIPAIHKLYKVACKEFPYFT